MRKNLLKTMVALAAVCSWTANAAAEENPVAEIPVKMTYVGSSNTYSADSIAGVCDTITVGYNKVPTEGSTIGWGNEGWKVNYIGYLYVDASMVPGIIQKATLKAKISNSTDLKRNTGWGIGLTDNAWSDQLNYSTTQDWTVSKLLNGGNLVWSTGGKTETSTGENAWDEVSFDITDALVGSGATGMATLIVFENQPAGGYLTEAVVEAEYEEYESTTTTIDFEDEDVSMFAIAQTNRMTITAVDDATNGTKVANFTCINRNGLPLGLYDFTDLAGKATMVLIEFDFNMGSVAGHHKITIGDALVHNAVSGGFSVGSKNNFGYGANGAIFYLGTDRGNLGGGNENYFKINETPKAASTLDVKADEVFGQWLHAQVLVNVDARKVGYVITKGEEELFAESGLPFINDAANTCTEFDVSFSNTGTSYIDNLEITSFKSNAVFADYTIKYVDANGNEIKDARTGNGQAGKPVALLESDKAAIMYDGVKYLYVGDDSETATIAADGSTVVTVTFREAQKYYAVLNCVVDGMNYGTGGLAQFRDNNTQWFWEGDSYYIRPSRGYKWERGANADGKYYFTAADSYNGRVVNFPGSIVPATQNNVTYYIATENYTLVDSVAYYSDFERLALPTTDEGNGTGLGQLSGTVNSWYSFSGGYFDRFSGGRGIRLDAGSYVWTEPIAKAGTYKVTIYGRNDISENCPAPYVLGYKLGEEAVRYDELNIPAWGSATTGPNVVENVAIPAGASLIIMNDGSVMESGKAKQISLDDISLTMTGDFVEPVVTAINNVVTAAQQNGTLYNLAGQAVKNATKGIYIKNGKKVVIK